MLNINPKRCSTFASIVCFFFISTVLVLAEVEKPPNIIVIMADDLGLGDLHCYGNEFEVTPHLDEFAKDGIRFTNFYANSPVCSPTRAALLAGQYPGKVGVPGLVRSNPKDCYGNLRNDVKLLPQYLKENGYQTALIGKWNLGINEPDLPNDRGFDFFKGFLDDKVDHYYGYTRNGFNFMRQNKKKITTHGHLSHNYKDWTINWLNQINKKEPFFLYLPLNLPHQPIQPPNENIAAVKLLYPNENEKMHQYLAFLHLMDENFGLVIKTLKDQNLYNNTIILFTSDNGGATYYGSSNGNYKGSKSQMYEGGLRVPLIIKTTNQLAKDFTNNSILSTVDVMPTLLAAANVNETFTSDGKSFYSIFNNHAAIVNSNNIFFERRDKGVRSFAYRKQNWKIIKSITDETKFELYDLALDPFEKTDQSKTAINIFNSLKKEIEDYEQISNAISYKSPFRFLHKISYWFKNNFNRAKRFLSKKLNKG